MYAHAQLLAVTERREYLVYLYFQLIPFKEVELFLVNEILEKAVWIQLPSVQSVVHNIVRTLVINDLHLNVGFSVVLFYASRSAVILNYVIFSYMYNPLYFAISIFHFVYLQEK